MVSKNKLLLFFILYFQILMLEQNYTDSVVSNIKQEYPDLRIEQEGNGIIKVTYPDGMSRLENIMPYPNRQIPEGVGYTYINVPYTDTIPFFWKYKFCQQLYLTNFDKNIKYGDVNRNGYPELYGFQYINNTFYPTVVFEKNETDHFGIIYSYPESNLTAESIYDVDGDSNVEVQIRSDFLSDFEKRFFSKPVKDTLATTLFFTFKAAGGDEPFVGNFDGDSLSDMIYTRGEIWIVEYNPQKVNFDTVYNLTYQWPNYTNLIGYAIGDFDQDSLTEFVMGDLFGKILILENTSNNTYDTTWSGYNVPPKLDKKTG